MTSTLPIIARIDGTRRLRTSPGERCGVRCGDRCGRWRGDRSHTEALDRSVIAQRHVADAGRLLAGGFQRRLTGAGAPPADGHPAPGTAVHYASAPSTNKLPANTGGAAVSRGVFAVLVDPRRFELLTSSMRTRRATNCAKGPYCVATLSLSGPTSAQATTALIGLGRKASAHHPQSLSPD